MNFLPNNLSLQITTNGLVTTKFLVMVKNWLPHLPRMLRVSLVVPWQEILPLQENLSTEVKLNFLLSINHLRIGLLLHSPMERDNVIYQLRLLLTDVIFPETYPLIQKDT